MYKYKKGMLLCILLAAASSVYSYAEENQLQDALSSRSFTAQYIGSKTTQQLNLKSKKGSEASTLSTNEASKNALAPLQGFVSFNRFKSFQSIFHPLLNFTSTTVSNAPQVNIIPLHASSGVGEKQYVVSSYQSIRSFNKHSGQPDGVLNTDADSFFHGDAQDVQIIYDAFSKHWFVFAETNSLAQAGGNLSIAVSSDSVINNNTSWYFYTIPNSDISPQLLPLGSGILSQLLAAVDHEAVYVTTQTYNNFGIFQGVAAIVINKDSLIHGNPHVTIFSPLVSGPVLAFSGNLSPASNFDSHSQFGYLISATSQVFPTGATYTNLFFYRIVYPAGNTPVLVGPFAIAVPPYTPPSRAPHKGNLYGNNGFLQTGQLGGLTLTHVRDGQLFACQPIQVNANGEGDATGDRVGVRWYQIDLTGDISGRGRGEEIPDTVPVLVQSGTLFDNALTDPLFYYIPAIMTNKKGDMVIEATVSGVNAFTDVVIATRHKKDRCNVLREVVYLTHNPGFAYNFGPLLNSFVLGQPWGDISSLVVDSSNDSDIWSTGQWAAVQNGWGLQTTQLKPGKHFSFIK